MAKELTEQEIREMFRKMDAPGSSTRELADWNRRDGAGPVPKSVEEMARFINSLQLEKREKARKTIAKHRD